MKKADRKMEKYAREKGVFTVSMAGKKFGIGREKAKALIERLCAAGKVARVAEGLYRYCADVPAAPAAEAEAPPVQHRVARRAFGEDEPLDDADGELFDDDDEDEDYFNGKGDALVELKADLALLFFGSMLEEAKGAREGKASAAEAAEGSYAAELCAEAGGEIPAQYSRFFAKAAQREQTAEMQARPARRAQVSEQVFEARVKERLLYFLRGGVFATWEEAVMKLRERLAAVRDTNDALQVDVYSRVLYEMENMKMKEYHAIKNWLRAQGE